MTGIEINIGERRVSIEQFPDGPRSFVIRKTPITGFTVRVRRGSNGSVWCCPIVLLAAIVVLTVELVAVWEAVLGAKWIIGLW